MSKPRKTLTPKYVWDKIKLPSEMTDEELAEVARGEVDYENIHEQQEEKPRFKHHTVVEDFITDLDIKPGRTRILNHVVYSTFTRWCDKNEFNTVTRKAFYDRMSYYFPRCVPGRAREYYYWLDPTPFKMSKRFKTIAKREYEKEKEISRSKKKQ